MYAIDTASMAPGSNCRLPVISTTMRITASGTFPAAPKKDNMPIITNGATSGTIPGTRK